MSTYPQVSVDQATLDGARTVLGPGTLSVDGTELAEGYAPAVSVGPLSASLHQTYKRHTVTSVADTLGVPVELLECSVEGCTSPGTFHHHHRALTRRRSPLACRCRHWTPASR